MIVLDASATVEWLLGSQTGSAVAERFSAPACSVHAPHLLVLEVASALRHYDVRGAMSARRARSALQDLADLDIQQYAHDPLLPRVWGLRKNLTAYDAVYVALAEALNAPLVTCDHRLARAPGHRAAVELITGDR